MNEKIRKLAEQAGGFPCSKDEWGFYNEGVEKFAELIVRECASIAFKYAPSDESACEISTKIEEHFGVEE